MSDDALARLRQIDRYIETLFAAEDEVLRAARAAMAAAGLRAINIPPAVGKLLYLLARLSGARRALEIGTLGGYSAIWLARALPPDGRLLTLEREEQHAAVARANLARAGLAERVEVRVGPALDSLAALAAARTEPFDLIFIDADKPAYPAYLDWAVRLGRPGTLIIADNVVRRGAVAGMDGGSPSDEAIRQFNQTLAAHPRLEATILPLLDREIDGLALARVRDER